MTKWFDGHRKTDDTLRQVLSYSYVDSIAAMCLFHFEYYFYLR